MLTAEPSPVGWSSVGLSDKNLENVSKSKSLRYIQRIPKEFKWDERSAISATIKECPIATPNSTYDPSVWSTFECHIYFLMIRDLLKLCCTYAGTFRINIRIKSNRKFDGINLRPSEKLTKFY